MEFLSILLGSLLACSIFPGASANNVNTTQLLSLPQCVQQCGLKYTTQFKCQPTDPCYCEANSPLQMAIAACVESTCDPKSATADGIMGLRFQADTCGWPIRDQTTKIVVVTWTLFALSTLFLIVRVLSRQRWLKGAGMGWDDWVAIAAYPFVIGMTVVGYYEPMYGSGKDVWRIPIEDLQPFLKWYYVGEPVYHVTVFLTKVSMVLLYLRIWPERPRGAFNWTCISVAILLVVTLIAIEVPSVVSCQPISYNWTEKFGGEGWCTNRTAAVYAYSGINIAFDVVVLTLPISRLWKLNLNWTHKIGIFAVFLVGFVVTACSIVRLTTVSKLETTTNPTWDFVPVAMWSLIEVYCSLIVVCMPAMAGIVKRSWRYAGSWRGTKISSTSMSFGGEGTTIDASTGRASLPPQEWADIQAWHSGAKADDLWADSSEKTGSLSPPPLQRPDHPVSLPPTAPLPAVPKNQNPYRKRASDPEARPPTHQSDMYFHDGENFVGLEENTAPSAQRTQPTTPQLFSVEEGNVHADLIPSGPTTPHLRTAESGKKKKLGADVLPWASNALGWDRPKRASDRYRTK